MFKSNKKSARRTKTGTTGTKKLSIRKIIDTSLIVLFVFSVVYISNTVHKVTATVTEIESLPDEIIRLQLIGSYKQKDILNKAEEFFSHKKIKEFDIMVVDVNCSELKDISNSIVISRDENLDHADMISEIVNFEENDILFRPLENNKKFITVTIVLGDDFENMLDDLILEEEN
ncbi:MAG: hypothetical protein U9N54_03445 [candidate division Zixibacteria bacterium]|nr:hypothetical protein [candidate division Zixibacteria bacterium]